MFSETTARISFSECRLFKKEKLVSGISACLAGDACAQNTLCASASSFIEHLYVFVVLVKGTKVSRGSPLKGGTIWWSTAQAALKWGPADWSVATRVTVRTEDSESDGDLTLQPPSSLLLPSQRPCPWR